MRTYEHHIGASRFFSDFPTYSKDFIVTNSSFNEIHGNTLATHNHIYGEFPISKQIVAKPHFH